MLWWLYGGVMAGVVVLNNAVMTKLFVGWGTDQGVGVMR